tara:strand:+ start:24857 stop:25102 length:246 start_codon:yes stop_codon:yes gene_type:complete
MATTNANDVQTASVTLTLNDLKSVCNIIQACSKRGAFEAQELKVVGELYERVLAVVTQFSTKQANVEEAEEEGDATPNGSA